MFEFKIDLFIRQYQRVVPLWASYNFLRHQGRSFISNLSFSLFQSITYKFSFKIRLLLQVTLPFVHINIAFSKDFMFNSELLCQILDTAMTGLCLSLKNCDFQVSVSVSKILISKFQSQFQYRKRYLNINTKAETKLPKFQLQIWYLLGMTCCHSLSKG